MSFHNISGIQLPATDTNGGDFINGRDSCN